MPLDETRLCDIAAHLSQEAYASHFRPCSDTVLSICGPVYGLEHQQSTCVKRSGRLSASDAVSSILAARCDLWGCYVERISLLPVGLMVYCHG